MRRQGARGLTLLLLSLLGTHAEILDRIAVTVGKQVITESEILRDVRVAAFMDEKPVDLSAAAKRQAADRMVEQILILEEAADSHITLSVDDELAHMLTQIEGRYTTPADFDSALKRYGIDQKDLITHLTAGLRMLQFTDLRFRPAVQVQDQDVRAYYDRLVAQAQAANPPETVPSFEDSRLPIEKLLTSQRVEEALDKWLATARMETPIIYRSQVVP